MENFKYLPCPPAIAVSFATFLGLNALSWSVAGSWICRKLHFVISFMELLLLRRLRYSFALFNKNLLFRTSMELALIYGCLLQVRVTVMEESWLNVSWSCRPPKICVLCVSSRGKGWWNGIWTRCFSLSAAGLPSNILLSFMSSSSEETTSSRKSITYKSLAFRKKPSLWQFISDVAACFSVYDSNSISWIVLKFINSHPVVTYRCCIPLEVSDLETWDFSSPCCSQWCTFYQVRR